MRIIDSDGNLNVFNLNRNESELWLVDGAGNPVDVWDPGIRFLFVRPRK